MVQNNKAPPILAPPIPLNRPGPSFSYTPLTSTHFTSQSPDTLLLPPPPIQGFPIIRTSLYILWCGPYVRWFFSLWCFWTVYVKRLHFMLLLNIRGISLGTVIFPSFFLSAVRGKGYSGVILVCSQSCMVHFRFQLTLNIYFDLKETQRRHPGFIVSQEFICDPLQSKVILHSSLGIATALTQCLPMSLFHQPTCVPVKVFEARRICTVWLCQV